MSELDMHVRSHEDWFIPRPNGEAVFADPFAAGEVPSLEELEGRLPRRELNPNAPTEALRQHHPYTNGYAYLGAASMMAPNLNIALILTDGERDAFEHPGMRVTIADSDIIAFGTAQPIGGQVEAGYSDNFYGAMADMAGPVGYGVPLLNLDIARMPDGTIIDPMDRLVAGMRDQTEMLRMGLTEYGHDDGIYNRIEASGLAAHNQELWRTLGSFGAQLYNEVGDRAEANVALVLPYTSSDVARRMKRLGFPEDNVFMLAGDKIDDPREQSTRGMFGLGRIRGIYKPER
ncbi:MAG TPA: hypothetical protein VD735_07410 [Candidatus Saccharimonadales bacterium]|nr:hypothetical protein [Candidatus Saccharimonadales bacterium]